MSELTKENIDKAISELRKEIKKITISPRALVKFTNSDEDQYALTFIDGDKIGYYLKFIPAICQKLNLKNILELGNREGFSTLCIWDHLPKDGSFVSVDIVKDLRFCPDAMFTDERVRFVYGDVSDPTIYNDNYPRDIDFMFMDTIHYDYQATDEFEVNQYFLADKALVAIDDINFNDKRKFFDRLPYQKWDLTDLCHDSGWGLFLYERNKLYSYEEKIFEAYKASVKIFTRKYQENEAKLEYINKRKVITIIKTLIKKVTPLYKFLIFIRNKIIK